MENLIAQVPESIITVLDYLDARSVVFLRRTCHFRNVEHEARQIEARSALLELLFSTNFPFTHAAYILGLNGEYYSYDTDAERHYGIPKILPWYVCRLFTLAMHNVKFTTIRIQKFSASANFGGHHRTLPFRSPVASANEDVVPQGYILCLSNGCRGGHAEICDDPEEGTWQFLTMADQRPRWVIFPQDSWIRWHWPNAGDLYVVTVTCEAPSASVKLRRHQLSLMTEIGFNLPTQLLDCAVDVDENIGARLPEDTGGAPFARASSARRGAAMRILRLENIFAPSRQEVEDAFECARERVQPHAWGRRWVQAEDPLVSPDGSEGWGLAQVFWARRILQHDIDMDEQQLLHDTDMDEQLEQSVEVGGVGLLGLAAPDTVDEFDG